MQIKKASYKALLWSSGSQLTQVAAGVIVIPVMIKYLQEWEVGLWYLFFSFYYLFTLFDLGFSPTYIRKLNHALALPIDDRKAAIPQLLHDVKKYYSILSLLISGCVLACGTLYLYLSFSDRLQGIHWMTWFLYGIGLTLGFRQNIQNVYLQGFGHVEAFNISQTIFRSIFVILIFLGFIAGLGILSLGVANIFAVLINYFILKKFLKAHSISTIQLNQAKSRPFRTLFDKEALKLGATTFSSFAINRSGTYFVSSFISLEANAAYSISLQLFQLIYSLSLIPMQTNMPFFNYTRKRNEATSLYNALDKCIYTCLGLYIIGSLIFFIIGKDILQMVGINVSLLFLNELIIIAIITALELNHVIAASFLMTKGTVPFAKAAIFSATAIIFLSFILVRPYGVLGILLARGFVQLSYNNWKWPLEVWKDRRIDLA